MEDKILGGETPNPPHPTAYIPGAEPVGPGATGWIPGIEEDLVPATAGSQMDTSTVEPADISRITMQGGLTIIPKDFEDKHGSWKTILSDNPFEVLYIDYRLHTIITSEMVETNYNILSSFWFEKSRLMTGGAREKIKSRYGEDTVNDANRKLQATYHKLRTKEGIDLYYHEVNTNRVKNGIKAIEELIDAVLAGGELRKEQANKIIAKGIKSGLSKIEVRNHLHETLIKNLFKPWSSKKDEDIFDGRWMTDAQEKITQARATDWLGLTVSTLEEAGEVTFTNKDKAYNRIANANYLPIVVTQLTNADKGFEFEEIITNEKDIERRYLKILYHLNHKLPFRINNYAFTNITQVFDMSVNDFHLYTRAFESYEQGHLHIWLNESDPLNAAKLPAGLDYNNFLKFVFAVNNRHPLYLKGEKFDTAEQLSKKALNDKTIWYGIAEALTNEQIPIWLEGTGNHQWIDQYNSAIELFIDTGYYNEDDKKLAAAQALIQVINPSVPTPKIIAEPNYLNLISIQGSRSMEHTIVLKLENQGFVKARIHLDSKVEGIGIRERIATLHNQAGTNEFKITLQVDSLKLFKNKLYTVNILITTPFETVSVPVDIKVVFPKTTFITYLLKYACLGAFLFGGIRFLMGSLTGNDSWMEEEYKSYSSIARGNLPENYFWYVVSFIMVVAGILGSISIIRKTEKI